ncbi:hypothetical protein ILUMI_10540 [Ignelater luminosus]|uniref:Costars domain-containing protein n=1 Tax=Ignelater luminosus TaxID=2038154 RepID=A0A8K0D6V9_IGNLU|nr:hypothetical protein ILUMI_10540 [Ignelater luminosus]
MSEDVKRILESEELREYAPPSLKDKVSLFNTMSSKHNEKQAVNPFSTDKNVTSLEKRRFSKEEYGRPVKGSKSETRGFKANLLVSREMLELCEIIHASSEPLNEDDENDHRRVISFGELFNIYVTISNKLVGMLLRARKQNLVDFEGEILFQRRDDDVPIVLLQPIEETRKIMNERIKESITQIKVNEPPLEGEESEEEEK